MAGSLRTQQGSRKVSECHVSVTNYCPAKMLRGRMAFLKRERLLKRSRLLNAYYRGAPVQRYFFRLIFEPELSKKKGTRNSQVV